jgi:hypothetical protein
MSFILKSSLFLEVKKEWLGIVVVMIVIIVTTAVIMRAEWMTVRVGCHTWKTVK